MYAPSRTNIQFSSQELHTLHPDRKSLPRHESRLLRGQRSRNLLGALRGPYELLLLLSICIMSPCAAPLKVSSEGLAYEVQKMCGPLYLTFRLQRRR